jgi:acyl carrier protein
VKVTQTKFSSGEKLMEQTIKIADEISSYLVDNFLFGKAEALREDETLLGNVIDSTGVVEFVMFLQDRFGITVEDDEVNTENLDSVKKASAYVTRKLGNTVKK